MPRRKSWKNHVSYLTIDLLIVFAIAVGLIALNFFVIDRFTKLTHAGNSAMFIRDDIPIIEEDEIISEIVQYQLGAYNMFELYDEDLNLMLSIQFNTEDPLPNTDISNYPEFVAEVKNRETGRFIIDRETEDGTVSEEVSFIWLRNNRDELRLIVVYSTKPVVENLWAVSLICYVILGLVFTLMLRFILRRSKDSINHYQQISSIL